MAEDSSTKSYSAGPVALLGLAEGANEIIGENIPASTSKSLRDEERLEVLLGGGKRWLGVPDWFLWTCRGTSVGQSPCFSPLTLPKKTPSTVRLR